MAALDRIELRFGPGHRPDAWRCLVADTEPAAGREPADAQVPADA
jgi:hypothetical protein